MLDEADVLLIFANQRSGHHAILNWIAEQHRYDCVHHNDVYIDSFVRGEIDYRGNREKFKYRNRFFSLKKLLIFNFENEDLYSRYKVLKSPILKNKNTVEIVILRDFYNNMASVIKSTSEDELNKKLKTHKKVWINLAEEFLAGNIYGVLYNNWFKDELYRKKVTEDLNLSFTDEGYEKITEYGGGSSFNLNEFTPLNRYKRYLEEELFLKTIDDPIIHSLNEEVFGWNLKMMV